MPMPPRPLPSRRKTGRGKRPNTNRKEREKRSAFRKCPVLSDNGRETERNAMNRPLLKTTLRKKMTARSDDTRRRPPSDRAVPKLSRLPKRRQRTKKTESRPAGPAGNRHGKTRRPFCRINRQWKSPRLPAGTDRRPTTARTKTGTRPAGPVPRISVELEGVEPSSKQGTQKLSTRLSFG